MYDLRNFALSDMTRCGMELRKLGAGASSMEMVAQRVVRYLHDSLRGPDGASACALTRFFLTLRYADLQPDLQRFASGILGGQQDIAPTLKCLTLLATAGELPAWNARTLSTGHKALPLTTAESIDRSPMIAQLIRQFGIEISSLIAPDPQLVIDAEQDTFNVFHVAEAQGSATIPAQREFVIPYKVTSVLGFGGMLPTAQMFAVILFSKVPIPRQTADLFKTLALNVKTGILPFATGPIFA